MKKMLTALAAVLFVSQAGALRLNLSNDLNPKEKLYFWSPGHRKHGNPANKMIIDRNSKKMVNMWGKERKNPFYFSRARDNITRKDKKGKFIIAHKVPQDAYFKKNLLGGWVDYNWNIANWMDEDPSLGIKVRRKTKIKNPWVKLDMVKWYLKDGLVKELSEKEAEKFLQ